MDGDATHGWQAPLVVKTSDEMNRYHESSCHPWKSLPYMEGRIYNSNATLPLIDICNKMSKRKTSGGRTSNPLSLDLDEEQIAALVHIGEIDPPVLRCLVPVLDSIRRAYSDVIPPHRRALPVSDITFNYERTNTNVRADSSIYRL